MTPGTGAFAGAASLRLVTEAQRGFRSELLSQGHPYVFLGRPFDNVRVPRWVVVDLYVQP